MKPIQSILAVVDPTTDVYPAAEHACNLASQLGATVELFICDYDQYLSGERFFDTKGLSKAREHLIERHKKNLQTIANSLKEKGCKVTTDARWDYPLADGILRKASESKCDLLVKETHYHNVLKRSVFSNTDWELIRGCESPLLLTKHDTMMDKPSIIAAVDPVHDKDKPARLDYEILNQAAALAKSTNGSLHIFHSYDPAPAYAVSADSMAFPISAPVREIAEGLKRQHETAMNELLQRWKTDIDYSIHLIEGDVRHSLLELIEEVNADIVTMGAVSRNALKRLFLGSTAEQILDHVPCNLLIVKTPAES